MQHIAKVVKKDPVQIRLNNMSNDDNAVPQMVKDLKMSADYDARKRSVDEFNQVGFSVFFPPIKAYHSLLQWFPKFIQWHLLSL
jgi:hypothetical protein